MKADERRVRTMETRFDKCVKTAERLEHALADFVQLRDALRQLETYYGSPAWRADLDADEAGLLPEGLKRGVLSEDGLWNLFEKVRELEERMAEMTDFEQTDDFA